MNGLVSAGKWDSLTDSENKIKKEGKIWVTG